VKGPSDAHILLTDGDGDGYEIVIGAHNNMKSVIRENKLEKEKEKDLIDTPNILSSTEWRRFWIEMKVYDGVKDKNGNITAPGFRIDVGKKGEWEPFMKRTWSIESIPYKFLRPKYKVFSSGNDRSLSFCNVRQVSFELNYKLAGRAYDPDQDIPELKDCSRESPCGYHEGDCSVSGDEGCEHGLVCGMDCGSIIPAMDGRCCVKLDTIINSVHEFEFADLRIFEAVPGGYSEWGPWKEVNEGWTISRSRWFWPLAGCKTGNGGARFAPKVVCGTKWKVTEEQSFS